MIDVTSFTPDAKYHHQIPLDAHANRYWTRDHRTRLGKGSTTLHPSSKPRPGAVVDSGASISRNFFVGYRTANVEDQESQDNDATSEMRNHNYEGFAGFDGRSLPIRKGFDCRDLAARERDHNHLVAVGASFQR